MDSQIRLRTGKAPSGASWLALSVFLLPLFALAQSPASRPAAAQTSAEKLASLNLDVARANPLALHAFLVRMPKGADLHVHLTGAVYAETFIRDAIEDHLCVDTRTFAFQKPQAAPAAGASEPTCAAGDVPVSKSLHDPDLYNGMVDAFSMRSFVPTAGVSAHDHFFDAFAKFGGTDRSHLGEWLDEVAARAAAQNEQYLELMYTPPYPHASALAGQVPWSDDFEQLRKSLLEGGIREDVAISRETLDQGEAQRRQIEKCGQPDASPACNVEIRFLYQVLREAPKERVFAQTLLGFEVASADPLVVGINYVQPEDGQISMSDYGLHMRIVGFFHSDYPAVHISLHAGELAPGLVPPQGLCCHVRLAVEQAHAERIGHGVDVMYEDRQHDLLKEMAKLHVMVEINLSSNDAILGVSGKDHPFPIYRQFGVPVALSTDDEGVSRIDLTHEYVRAVETYGLHYADLKQMVRTSLEHSFLPGNSLWQNEDSFTQPVPSCAHEKLGADKPSAPCAAFLKSSEKASQQWELERRFDAFEFSF
ncbi:MAG TPA: adenosine deaminase [Methylomirabilota bacterium]|nr:adenosine deaminase [Methylomirabilota bacterium]